MRSRKPVATAAAVAVLVAVMIDAGSARGATQPGDEMRLNVILSAGGAPIANLEQEFGTAGWRYLYNANGPLGNSANYAPLTLVNGQYTDPGGKIVMGKRPVDPGDVTDVAAYPPPVEPFFPPEYPATFARPGLGTAEDPAGIERAVIFEYTIQADDLPAGTPLPVQVAITGYDFAVSTLATFPDGMSARVYGEDNLLLEFGPDTIPFPPGFRFATALDPDPIPLGAYNVGDTITFALGSAEISVIPEPAAAALLVPGALLLMRRRRDR